jgi:chromosome segregation ATPase
VELELELGSTSPVLGPRSSSSSFLNHSTGQALGHSHHQHSQSMVTETSASRLLAQSHEALAVRNAELTQTTRERQQDIERLINKVNLLQREKHALQLSLADADARLQSEATRNTQRLRELNVQLSSKTEELFHCSLELEKVRRDLTSSRAKEASEVAEMAEALALAQRQVASKAEENRQLQELLKQVQVESVAAQAQAKTLAQSQTQQQSLADSSAHQVAAVAAANAELQQSFEAQALVVEQLIDEKKELERQLALTKQQLSSTTTATTTSLTHSSSELARWTEEALQSQASSRAAQRELDDFRARFAQQLASHNATMLAERQRHAQEEAAWEARLGALQAELERARRAQSDAEASLLSPREAEIAKQKERMAQLAQMAEERDAARAEADAAKQNLRTTQARVASLQEELNTEQVDHASARSSRERLHAEYLQSNAELQTQLDRARRALPEAEARLREQFAQAQSEAEAEFVTPRDAQIVKLKERLNLLAEERDAAQAEADAAKQNLRSAQVQVASLTEDLRAEENAHANSRTAREKLLADHRSSQEENSELHIQLDRARRALPEAEARLREQFAQAQSEAEAELLSPREAQIAKLKERLNQLVTERDAAQARADTAEQNVRSAQTQVASLTEALRAEEAQHASARAAREKLLADHRSSQEQNAELQTQLDRARRALPEMEARLREQFAQAQSEAEAELLSPREAQIAKQKERLNQLVTERDAAQGRADTAEQNLRSAQAQVVSLTETLRAEETAHANARTAREKLYAEHLLSQESNAELQTQLDRARRALPETEARLREQLVQAQSEAEAELVSRGAQIAKQKERFNQLATERDAALAEADASKQTLRSAEAQVASLNEALKTEQAALANARAGSEKLRAEYLAAMESNAELQAKHEAATTTLAQQKRRLEERQKEAEQLRDELAQLQDSAHAQAASLHEVRAEGRAERAAVERELAQRVAELSAAHAQLDKQQQVRARDAELILEEREARAQLERDLATAQSQIEKQRQELSRKQEEQAREQVSRKKQKPNTRRARIAQVAMAHELKPLVLHRVVFFFFFCLMLQERLRRERDTLESDYRAQLAALSATLDSNARTAAADKAALLERATAAREAATREAHAAALATDALEQRVQDLEAELARAQARRDKLDTDLQRSANNLAQSEEQLHSSEAARVALEQQVRELELAQTRANEATTQLKQQQRKLEQELRQREQDQEVSCPRPSTKHVRSKLC